MRKEKVNVGLGLGGGAWRRWRLCWTLCECHHLEGRTLGGRREIGVQWIGRAAKSRVWAWVAGRKPSEEERGDEWFRQGW